jgi:hypothetical protein
MRRHAPQLLSATALAGLLSLLVVGVATDAGAASTTRPATGRSFPGAFGSVAAITGSSIEVQNSFTGQVTVSWTTSTTFTQTATVPASSVTVGDCVTVSGSASKKTKEVTAKTVSVTQPTTGKCTGGFGGSAGNRSGASGAGGFAGGGPPGGGSFRTGSGGPPGGGKFPGGSAARRFAGAANVGFASGKVTAVTATSMEVSGFSSASITSSKKPAKGKRPSLKATTVKVALTSSTAYSQRQPAASANLAVGDCVMASGPSNSTGAVAASTILITSTGGKSCTTGFASAGG